MTVQFLCGCVCVSSISLSCPSQSKLDPRIEIERGRRVHYPKIQHTIDSVIASVSTSEKHIFSLRADWFEELTSAAATDEQSATTLGSNCHVLRNNDQKSIGREKYRRHMADFV